MAPKRKAKTAGKALPPAPANRYEDWEWDSMIGPEGEIACPVEARYRRAMKLAYEHGDVELWNQVCKEYEEMQYHGGGWARGHDIWKPDAPDSNVMAASLANYIEWMHAPKRVRRAATLRNFIDGIGAATRSYKEDRRGSLVDSSPAERVANMAKAINNSAYRCRTEMVCDFSHEGRDYLTEDNRRNFWLAECSDIPFNETFRLFCESSK